jgi:hypothetical protein
MPFPMLHAATIFVSGSFVLDFCWLPIMGVLFVNAVYSAFRGFFPL